MVSLTNSYFHQTKMNEQSLLDGLVKESIQVQGLTYWYLPRDVQVENIIFGEDVISKFTIAIPIEMYLIDSQGFQGDKEMFSKFGLELRNSYKLAVHKGRWETEIKSQFDKNAANGESNIVINNYIRPREGDLVFDPITNFLMEIKFVDHDAEFFALGKNYLYTLSLEAFQYNNEEIVTGIAEIDVFHTNSTDKLLNQLLFENGDAMIQEQMGYLILEDGNVNPPMREYGTVFKPEADKLKVLITDPFA